LVDAVNIILLISATLLLGFIGALCYSKTKIPDIIWLLGFGIILGPITHLYDSELFISLSTLMSLVALNIILFEAGISVNIKAILKALPRSLILIAFTFTMTVISVGYFLNFFMPQDFTLLQGLLLGTMVGGSSTVTTFSILEALERMMDVSALDIPDKTSQSDLFLFSPL